MSLRVSWLVFFALVSWRAAAQPQGQGAAAPAVTPPLARTNYDMRELAQPPKLSAAQIDGRRLFVQYCALCHDSTGQPTHGTYGPPITRAFLDAFGESAARAAVLKGSERMPGFRYMFKPADVDHLVAFIKTLSPVARTEVASVAAPPPAASPPAAAPSAAVPPGAPLTGAVHATTGEPLAGVAVSARADGSTITTTVFTDPAGNWVLTALAPGRYGIMAQAVGYEPVRASGTVGAAPSPRVSLRLARLERPDDIYPQLSSAEWLDSLPDETRDDKRMKEVLRLNCTECHGANVALERRFDEAGWSAIIKFMEQGDYGGWMGGSGDPSQRDSENIGFGPTIKFHAGELAAYLARVRGAESAPLELKLLPRPSGAAARVIITGYDIPPSETPHELAWWDGSEWSKGAASGMHGAGGMHDVVADRQGNAWLTESLSNDARTITKVDGASGQVTGFALPPLPGSPWKADISHGIGIATDGIVWFGELGKLGRIDPVGGSFQTFQTPTPASLVTLWDATWKAMGGTPPMQMSAYLLGTIDEDSLRKIWGTAFLGVWRFDPTKSQFSYYHDLSLPTADPPPPERYNLLFTYGVAGDAVGNGWWTTPNDDRVVTADVKTGKVQEIVMRPPWYSDEASLATPADRAFTQTVGAVHWHGILPGAQYPRRMGADKNGTTVWVPNWYGRNLARIDINTKAVVYHKLPINGQPYFVKVDKHHVVWTNLTNDDRVMSFDPASDRWTVFRLPINGCESRQMTVDDRTGDVWVPCYRASKVYRIRF